MEPDVQARRLHGGYISLTAVSFYNFSTYMTTFLRRAVDLPSDLVLMTNVVALAFVALIAPVIGRVCDRIGRRPTMIASAVLRGGLAIPAYTVSGLGSVAIALGAQLMLAVGAVMANVVTAMLLSEVFLPAVRYTASAVTYNVSYALFGGTAPFVATFLIAQTGNQGAASNSAEVAARTKHSDPGSCFELTARLP